MDQSQDKPRKLEDELCQYLLEIDNSLSSIISSNNISKLQPDNNQENDEKEILIENVLSEMKNRTASAMSDKRTNFTMEKLCLACNMKNALDIFQRCNTYSLFLARNRYSSHVIQAIISRLCAILKNNFIEDLDEVNFANSIISFIDPIMKEIAWLSSELSASHVIRSIICLLCGIPTIAEKKGKGSKHQHAPILSESLESLIDKGKFYIGIECAFKVPAKFHGYLIDVIQKRLLILPSNEMQAMIANPSSSAVLGVLIRILSNDHFITFANNPHLLGSSGLSASSQLVDQLVQIAFEAQASDSNEQTEKLFYAMSGDQAGSYFMEAIIECAPLSTLIDILSKGVGGKCLEFSEDKVANFVLQTILRRLGAELAASEAMGQEKEGAVVALSRRILHELYPTTLSSTTSWDGVHGVLPPSSSSSFSSASWMGFRRLVDHRGGVVHWMVELAYRLDRVDPPSHHIMEGVRTSIIMSWIREEEDSLIQMDQPVTPQRIQDLSNKLGQFFQTNFVAIDPKADPSSPPPPGHPSSTSVPPSSMPSQLLLAKIIASLLQPSPYPSVAVRLLMNAISLLSSEALLHIATSGQLSKAILDTFFDVSQQQQVNAKSRRGEETEADSFTPQLFRVINGLLQNHAVRLANHYVGQHVVRRAFDVSDLRTKERWAGAMIPEMKALSQKKEGRNTLQHMNVDELVRSATQWRASWKIVKVREVDSIGKKHSRTEVIEPQPTTVGDEATQSEGNIQKKRKRKRNRSNKII